MARKALGPATLRIAKAVDRAADACSFPAVVVGCSGGPDSLALAVVTQLRVAVRVSAVIVDHGVQHGSGEVASRTARLLTHWEVPHVIITVAPGTGGGPEAAARDARHDALRGAADQQHAEVWLAHTRDDQAEQVLLGLVRGSGARSLAGMRPVRDGIRRPLLDLTRTDTAAACAELGLEPWVDPHNADRRFTRPRVRHAVMPILERELGPGIAASLARSADLLRADADLLDTLADEAYETVVSRTPQGSTLDRVSLDQLPAALAGRVLLRWLRGSGASNLSARHVAAVLDLAPGQAADLPGVRVEHREGALVRRRRGQGTVA